MDLNRRDLLRLGAAAAASLSAVGCAELTATRRADPAGWAGKSTGAITRIPTMCQSCTTACGVLATIKDGRLLQIVGNPEDPNSRGSVCAKGVAGPSILYDPFRVLYPLRRVGPRGSGQWRRITWEEAYAEIADKLKDIRERGHPEEFAFQQGRNRSADIINRFLDSYGTPSSFNHRALCSANRRAALLATVGDSDWDLGDYEHTDYILNFGCNWTEAMQGHIPIVTRIMQARANRGAKIVTFESRLSNTAAVSDEWFCVKPGTDGLIALALSHVICTEGLWNKAWLDRWSNYPADEYTRHLAPYTPELAERESGVPADTLRRLAREFAAKAPRCTTTSGRGSHAHYNGFYNDRAITVLNALVGNMGMEGGFCWHPLSTFDTKKQFPEPAPVPPKPTAKSVIADAKQWPLANAWNRMKVGEIVYLWIKERRQKISALMTYNTDQAWSWPEMQLVQEVLKDEELVPFHFCLDVMMSETAHLADLVLPWTTWLERWDIDARPPLGLIDYVGIRQPVVAPLGESKDVREIFPELARRIGGGMEQYFPWASVEEYLEQRYASVPGGFAFMRQHGAWIDPAKKPNYQPYERPLDAEELAGSSTDPQSGVITKGEDPKTKKPAAIGIVMDGVAVRGFTTPSRKLEVKSEAIVALGRGVDKVIEPLPVYLPIPDLAQGLADDQLIMISFKWNVHNAHRTMQSKWLMEIVSSNPAWMHPRTAKRLGLSQGDWIEVTGHRPRAGDVPRADGSPVGSQRTRVHLTEGVHPQVLAFSHNAGRWMGGPIAAPGSAADAWVPAPVGDRDAARVPWQDALRVPQNSLIPIYPDPTTGQQAWNDTVVRVRKA
ncbi:MAG: molybdopterin-dependent oxidoreductase [Deltaproteobacteria bacterium]|nr:molybdopterin-dependent oxidoreductase [Deltaproteobacteria bacterium]